MRILLALDASPMSLPPLREIALRPWPTGTAVRVVSVVEEEPAAALIYPLPELGMSVGAPAQVRALQVAREAAEQLVQRAATTVRAAGLTVDAVVRVGDPAHLIVREALAWDADLILLGAHPRVGMQRLMMGSVAKGVVARAPCSVEVVRERPARVATAESALL